MTLHSATQSRHRDAKVAAKPSRPARFAMAAALAATLAILGVLTGSTAVAERNNPDFKVTRADKVMGTIVQVTFWTDDEERAAKAAAAVFAEFHRIDKVMTTWLPDSEVSQVNAAAGGKAVKVSAEVMSVLSAAQAVSKQSKGAFDISVGAFKGLWKFDQDLDGSIPTEADVKARRRLVDYRQIALDAKQSTARLKKKGMQITLGGIAKGYAVDRAVAMLRAAGFVDFLLQAGGDLYVSGKKGAKSWVVGIRDPRGERSESFAVAQISNKTFSTSGDYERGFVLGGVRYHHILDPKTGSPANRSRSVTVMADDALTADAWSTALFVMGVKDGMKLVEATPNLDAVFVDADNKVHISSGLTGKVYLQAQPTPGP